MRKRKFKLPDEIDWKLVTACRKKGETWKEISARTGTSHKSLREWAVRLKKTELLRWRGSNSKVDWSLIEKLYKQGKPLDEIAAKAGFASCDSLSVRITHRRKDGRWKLPKRLPRRLVISPELLAILYPPS
jgi:hypothetical protein